MTSVDHPEQRCSMCKGPFHSATGHEETTAYDGSPLEHPLCICGACYRGLLKMLREYRPRRWGGIRFYDHAKPPPAEAPVGFRPEDVQDDTTVSENQEAPR